MSVLCASLHVVTSCKCDASAISGNDLSQRRFFDGMEISLVTGAHACDVHGGQVVIFGQERERSKKVKEAMVQKPVKGSGADSISSEVHFFLEPRPDDCVDVRPPEQAKNRLHYSNWPIPTLRANSQYAQEFILRYGSEVVGFASCAKAAVRHLNVGDDSRFLVRSDAGEGIQAVSKFRVTVTGRFFHGRPFHFFTGVLKVSL